MSQPYPHAQRIRYDALSVAVAWALLVLSVVLWLFAVALAAQVLPLFTFALFAFFAAAAVHLILAFTHKCPVCGKHPTVQGFKPVHPDAARQSKLTGWSGVVVRVLVGGPFVCIHCGTEFTLNEARA
jgi:hypothetical protein